MPKTMTTPNLDEGIKQRPRWNFEAASAALRPSGTSSPNTTLNGRDGSNPTRSGSSAPGRNRTVEIEARAHVDPESILKPGDPSALSVRLRNALISCKRSNRNLQLHRSEEHTSELQSLRH